jgi:hypothetical protein
MHTTAATARILIVRATHGVPQRPSRPTHAGMSPQRPIDASAWEVVQSSVLKVPAHMIVPAAVIHPASQLPEAMPEAMRPLPRGGVPILNFWTRTGVT